MRQKIRAKMSTVPKYGSAFLQGCTPRIVKPRADASLSCMQRYCLLLVSLRRSFLIVWSALAAAGTSLCMFLPAQQRSIGLKRSWSRGTVVNVRTGGGRLSAQTPDRVFWSRAWGLPRRQEGRRETLRGGHTKVTSKTSVRRGELRPLRDQAHSRNIRL
jgi:hypothetical protein